MGRQNGDPTMVNSSIALLQERFRQLQKVKERREERELQKFLSETERVSNLDPSKQSFQSETIFPHDHRKTPQESLSLGLDLQSKQADLDLSMKTETLTNPWSLNTASSSSSKGFENSEIDTSLHL
ncbi:hypothetical protein FEM48_Zijuj04G0133700 [Ziziphus jujuba var. spinosa]|uniref:Uncharacterized protein n=1 Tax=Ziziphus jujuba var. spinosa TaxID=714518 RepID=A0A978VK48_ZIZJJ|nr:hypothetical protein FEM48_Zijuj04G0133700 [Ziziphus jujuba var. spinosa]